ncbi:MAG TPA: carboxymuconolactone decarboxylase family protein [Dongiaceae bacterium]|nr:carboxymuconolactone decarboxylase family protein [Dongiaceae bacterium]
MNANKTDTVVTPKTRLENRLAAPAVLPAMLALQQVVNESSLESSLVELVKLRASQINRCAFCIDMHYADALARGERADRLYLLDAWEETDRYTPRERAALHWAEAVTRLPDAGVSDAVFAQARANFSEAELQELTLAIVAINGWNRFNVAFRVPPGTE